MICAIHQPNFMPWYPYFEKIQACDIFVILTECQFGKNGFQNRFHIGKTWYTMPVYQKTEKIKTKTYIDPLRAWKRIKNKLFEYKKYLDVFDNCISSNLAFTNTAIIVKACAMLGIRNAQIEFDYPTELKSNERLIDICKHFKCDTYIAGAGSTEYINEKLFIDNEIEVKFQQTKPESKISLLERLYLCG